jgi:hypothetical protein
MSLFRRLFNWRMPSGLVEISGNILGASFLIESPLYIPVLGYYYGFLSDVIKLSLLGRLGKTCPPQGFFQVQRITRGNFCSRCVQGGSSGSRF